MKKSSHTFYSDKRASLKKSEFTENNLEAIRAHINSLSRDIGHDKRAKSKKEYLNTDLNVNRL